MYRTPHQPLLVIAALAVTACATVPHVDYASEEASIRGLGQRYMQAVRAKDAAAIAALFAPDGYFMPPNAPMAAGSLGIQNMWSNMLKMPDLQLAISPVRIDIAKAGDLANEVGTYQATVNTPAGKVDDVGKYTMVWKKISGEWKIESDIFNSDRPMPQPPPAVVVMEVPEPQMEAAAGLQWADLVLPGFAPGVKIAVLHGDPSKAGSDYTLRLRLPDKYLVPPHWHPKGEHVTVLSGNFLVAMGPRADMVLLKSYLPGDFVYLPAKMPHFAASKGETIVQLHGEGPFQVNLVTQ
jgi:uncharacterized protein (TIGR02246 family)